MNARRFSSALVALLACLALAVPALAEPSAYLRIKGASGEIKGGVVLKGRENMIEVVAVDHGLAVPTEAAAASRTTGRRQHKPLLITKLIDKSTPLLRTALVQNEMLKEVTLQFYGMSAKGLETNTFTITLKNARITSIHHVMPDNRLAENARLSAYEEIGFTYEEITWTWNDGGITATDNVVR